MELKHKIAANMKTGSGFFQRNWMKLIVIAMAFQVVASKDIQFSMDLSSAKASIYTEQEGFEKEDDSNSVSDLSSQPFDVHIKEKAVEVGHADPSIPQPANTFSNLGFVLNPNYAQKHKVAKRIVKFHNNKCTSYIKKYVKISQKEMREFGIPASIKLAQGLLESNAGDSRLSLSNNNHFGIKCFSKKCKKGHCSNFTDDSHKDFFRKYKSVEESYRAHSKFLQKDRYIHLKTFGTKDYKSWAKGLKESGYATDKRYEEKLIRIIEALKLYQYDE